MGGRRWRRTKSIDSLLLLRFPSVVAMVMPSSRSAAKSTSRAPALREQLIGLLRPGASRLVVDLSGVTFCDASGLAVLVGVARRVGLLGGVLRLAAPTPLVSTVLRLTGLDSRFEIFASVPEAIGAPTRPSVHDAGGSASRCNVQAAALL
jgi:anti-anti-sigma factor